MKLTFENLGTLTYLVYEITEADELDSMSLGMLTNNSIPGFAPASFTQMDATKYIKYNVSAKVSAAQLFSGMVTKKRLLGVFSGIVDAMLAAEDYMIDTSSLLLDLEYIFSDVSTCDTVVICLPIMNLEGNVHDASMFFKNIIFNTQFDQTENCDYVAKILNYLNSNPVLYLPDFKELLTQLAKSEEPVKATQPKAVTATPAAATQSKPQPVVAPANQSEKKIQVQPQVVTPTKHENLKFGNNYPGAGQQTPHANAGKTTPPVQQASPEEKPMSMFYLLQHYNKENAATYKAQQAAKKAKKAAPQAPAAQPVQPKAPTKQAAPASFAVPGKPETPAAGFAIPGQQQPVAPNQNAQPQASKPVATAPAQVTTPAYSQTAQPSRPINFGETTVLGGAIGETTVLGAIMEPAKTDPHLIRSKNNEKSPLNKPVFRIGKERSYVDYFISDNTAISRGHANIVNHNSEFFIVDTNSTNHTYVNGTMIQPGVEMKLSHGDKVRLANEDFEFRLY